MAAGLSSQEREQYLPRLAALLDRARVQRQTMTYLAVADALAIPGPRRIHKTTRLVELLLKQDAEAGRPIRAALVTSRSRPGLPAPGFFDRAWRLGLFDGEEPRAFHRSLLDELLRRDRPE